MNLRLNHCPESWFVEEVPDLVAKHMNFIKVVEEAQCMLLPTF